jgi:cytochrome c peroxidase
MSFRIKHCLYGFRNIGLLNGRELNDSGRVVISGDLLHLGKFKIAPLRNVAISIVFLGKEKE